MAVEVQEKTRGFAGRQLAVGANVLVATLLVIALVTVLQWGGYRFGPKADCTSSGVNSLSEGTRNLLGNLDTSVRITSAYFQTDLEAESQAKFRQAVADLVELFQIENRSKIEVDSFNPLQDHAAREQLLKRLAKLPKFQEQSAKHRELIDAFHNKVLPKITELLNSDLEAIAAQGGSLGGEGGEIVQRVRAYLQGKQRDLGVYRDEVRSALEGDVPQYSSAVSLLTRLYRDLSKALKDLGGAAKQAAAHTSGLDQAQYDYLDGAEQRYAELVAELDEQTASAGDLPRLDLEDFVRELAPGANAIVVETGQDARVLGFTDVWPPLDPSLPTGSMAFKDRSFAGEQKLSSAILQLSSQEKTAVVFVRYGGPPLFMGGFMPGQPPARYGRVKVHLEDLNFDVHEWDVSQQTEPPEIDPPPTKTIFVALKPESPPGNPMQRQQQPTFGPAEREAVVKAIEESGRALFVVGWYQGPYGAIPSTYEYGQYLTENWGITVETGMLLLRAVPIGPGKFRFGRTAALMADASYGEHSIVERLNVLPAVYPNVCPLELAQTPPEGVSLQELVRCDRREGLWGARSLQAYREQINNEYVTKVEGDAEGPFLVAAAATKGDAKIVVVSAREFFTDDIAFSVQAMLTAEGLTLRSRNPGNLTLLANSLHWLNDHEEIMNLGRPVDVATLEISEGPVLSFLRVLVWGIWPALAMVGGGAVWYVRRR